MPVTTKKLTWGGVFLLLICMFPMCSCTCCVGGPHLLGWATGIRFDSERWKKGGPDCDKMVYDLRYGGYLDGKTRKEVEELLGPGLDDFDPRGLVYFISCLGSGVMPWERGDTQFLLICFDGDVVVEIQVKGF